VTGALIASRRVVKSDVRYRDIVEQVCRIPAPADMPKTA
jgi:hypothetical protein